MRESDLEDAREVAAATAGNRSNPKPILKTIKEDSVETPSRRARFAEVVNVQVHIFDDESEDEQSLEDYFGDWSDLDKETILLGKSILEFDVSLFLLPFLHYADISSLGSHLYPQYPPNVPFLEVFSLLRTLLDINPCSSSTTYDFCSRLSPHGHS